MTIEKSKSVGIQLCEIFGFDPTKVSCLSLHVPADSIVYLDVTHIVYQKEMKKVVELLKGYRLERTDTTSEIKGTDSNDFRTFEI